MTLSLRQVLDLRLAGAKDDLSLLAAVGGGMFANPLLAGVPDARIVGAAVTALGAGALLNRALDTTRPRVFTSRVDVRSQGHGYVKDLEKDWGGVIIGYTVDTGKPVVIPWEDWMGHCLIVGTTGMGKTVLQEWLIFQQIMRGGGVIFIDGKVDISNIIRLTQMCAYAGRRHDLRIINPDDPSMSNTYSPVLFGEPDEVSSRVISLIPSAETNPGADHYRQSGNQGVTTSVAAVQATGLAYSFRDLSILLQNDEAMKYLGRIIPPGRDEGAMYQLFLSRFKVPDRQGNLRLDLKKIEDLFGGIGGRLFSFSEGNFGRITNTYSPEVRMYEDIMAGRVIYVALPTMGKNEAAKQFGKMTVGDYRSAIARIQRLAERERPWPPTLGDFDEAGAYVTDAWSRIFEQSRSARQVLVPSVQTLANLEVLGKELAEMVVGNTVTKVMFRVGTHGTAEELADLIGKEQVAQLSVSAAGSNSGSAEAGTGKKTGVQSSQNMGYSERYEETYRVPSDDLKKLERGEAIVTTNGGDIYHVKIPRVGFNKAFQREVGDPSVNHIHTRKTPGLELFRRFGKPDNGSGTASKTGTSA